MTIKQAQELSELLRQNGYWNSSIDCQFDSVYELIEEDDMTYLQITMNEIKQELNDVFGLAL